ncbi:MAG TPA: hypothetical protein PLV31_03635 [Gammaproteobacteria bacterium]|nr:hypothetical protein [Gammaproteobacteria bacterium]HRA42764.1 hypothetical protein [Gammaproteobacteria bacterium]
MQRMDSLDSASNKIVFKKQNYRPWNTPVQEETKTLFEPDNELNRFDNDRLLIGGFSFPNIPRIPCESEQSQKSTALMDELKSKEQEIQTLSTNLKIANALEHAEKIEFSRKKEVLARTIAEEKALNATQQLNLTETALQKTKQQLQTEQQLKAKEESIRKSLETEIKNVLHAIEDNENTIAREIEIRRITEEKLNETLRSLSEKEHRIRLEAEKIIRDNLRDSIEREKNIEKKLEERINNLQNEHKEQTLKIQCETELRIAEAEEKMHLYEKAKIEAQNWLQKSQETTRQIKIEKTEVERDTTTLIESLNLQIQQLTKKSIAIENEKTELTTLFTDTLGKSKILQSIASNERQLRIILEEKLSGSTLRKTEINKKLFENKVLELAEKISALEIEKAKSQEQQDNALEQAHKIEILMASEMTIKKSLAEKNKILMAQIYDLERAKQKEKDEKDAANYKISELISKKQHLEMEQALIEEQHNTILLHTNQLEIKLDSEKSISTNLEKKLVILIKQKERIEREKTNMKEMYNKLTARISELETMLESEKSLRKDAEKLQMIGENTRKAAQEKINATMEQANKTVLTILENYTTTELLND